MFPTRLIPSTNPTHDRNISPIKGYTFTQLKSMQNVQTLMYSPGANKYICKYIGKVDYIKYTAASTDAHKYGEQRTVTFIFIQHKIDLFKS